MADNIPLVAKSTPLFSRFQLFLLSYRQSLFFLFLDEAIFNLGKLDWNIFHRVTSECNSLLNRTPNTYFGLLVYPSWNNLMTWWLSLFINIFVYIHTYRFNSPGIGWKKTDWEKFFRLVGAEERSGKNTLRWQIFTLISNWFKLTCEIS